MDGEPRVSHQIIAEHTQNKPKSILDLITRNSSDFEEFGELKFNDLKSLNGGRPQRTYFLSEQQATLLMTYLRNSEIVKNFKKRLVKEFFEMRKQLQSGSTPKDSFQQRKEQFQLDVIGLESSFRLLRVNEASKIGMTHKLYKEHGLSTSYLPKYSDEQHTYSLSHLLKKYEVGISAKKLNLILLSEGYLEIKTRKSTGSTIKTFKSLTEKGLEFGKNVISPHNQLETQPHYFENRFEELIKLLNL
jgi:hypothetical protein